MAGTDTTSHTLVTAIWHLLDGSPHMVQRLKDELKEAIPDKEKIPDWATLEKLPYLVRMIPTL